MEFCEWQETQVDDLMLKEDFKKAHDVAMAHALDLEILYEDNDPEFLVTHGLKRGTARHMVGGIPEWVKKRRFYRVTPITASWHRLRYDIGRSSTALGQMYLAAQWSVFISVSLGKSFSAISPVTVLFLTSKHYIVVKISAPKSAASAVRLS